MCVCAVPAMVPRAVNFPLPLAFSSHIHSFHSRPPLLPQDANELVRQECIGKNACKVKGDTATLGDPCYFCRKVLQITAR